jgi:hypothetical protein
MPGRGLKGGYESTKEWGQKNDALFFCPHSFAFHVFTQTHHHSIADSFLSGRHGAEESVCHPL